MTEIVYLGLSLYVLATSLYLIRLFNAGEKIESAANLSLIATILVWLAVFAGLGMNADWEASSTQRWLWSSAWMLSVTFVLLRRRFQIDGAGSTVVGLAAVLAALGFFSTNGIANASEQYGALLKLHIALAFIGVTAFGFAAAVSVLYLLQARGLKKDPSSTLQRRLPPLVTIDKLSFRAILVGFPFYTGALLIGSAFAIGGQNLDISLSYWMSLFSWVIYAFILQVRVSLGWRGRRTAFLTIIGLIGIITVLLQYSTRGA